MAAASIQLNHPYGNRATLEAITLKAVINEMPNQTDAIKDDTERYIWAVYHIFVFLSSLVGDSLILHASFQPDAFKLNKFIVSIIRHISACDLIYAVSSVLPSAISLLANSWVLGKTVCIARFYLGNFSYVTGLYLIACLTVSKLILLKYPIRYSNWTGRSGHLTCCIISTISLPFIITCLVTDTSGHNIGFTYKAYTCDLMPNATISKHKELRTFFLFLDIFAPMFVISVTTIPTLGYLAAAWKTAHRAGANVPWQGTLTVAMTAVICCLATRPNIIFHVLITLNKSKFEDIRRSRTAKFLLFINIMSNFYIYTMTIRSFRRFLQSRLSSFMSNFSRCPDVRVASG